MNLTLYWKEYGIVAEPLLDNRSEGEIFTNGESIAWTAAYKL